jgi:monooxygenase
MLQRSPSYIISQPKRDKMADRLNGRLPENMAYTAVRWKNVLRQVAFYEACQKWPHRMRKILLGYVERRLPEGYDMEKHFGPHYNPWDQRLCVVPRGDLFRAIRHGQADIVTDTIDRFTRTGIRLTSGEELQADIIITATGLNMQLLGGVRPSRNREPFDLTSLMTYKGCMFSGVPNFATTFGYTNIGWTLKADLVSEFVCRLLNYMDAQGFDNVEPQHPGDDVDELPFMDFSPGYFQRSMHLLPKSGSRAPWRLKQNYFFDMRMIRHGKIDDEGLRFAKKPAAAAV